MSIIDKIKILFKLNSVASAIKEANVKSGWKTSEFWLVVLSQLVPVIMLLWSLIPASVILWLMGIGGTVAILYAVIRSYVKATPNTKDDEVFNRVVAILKPIFDKINVPVELIPVPKAATNETTVTSSTVTVSKVDSTDGAK